MKTYRIIATIRVSKNNISRTLFQNAILEMEEGEMIILKAPNGSGKTTLIKALLGSIEQTNKRKSHDKNINLKMNFSDIKIFEHDNLTNIEYPLDQISLAQRVAYMKQSFPDNLIKGTIEDFIKENLRGAITDNQIDTLYKNDKFLRLVDNLIMLFYYETNFNYQKFSKKDLIKHMSGGELQVLLFISVILRSLFTDIIILDEPFNNVGYSQKRMINDIIKKINDDFPQKIFLVISHCTIINLSSFSKNKCLTINSSTNLFESTSYNNFSCLEKTNGAYFDYEAHIVNHDLQFKGIV